MIQHYILTKSSITEKVVKTYHCTEMIFPKCDGYLSVTNKRVVFHGLAKKADWLDVIIARMKNLFLSSIGKNRKPHKENDIPSRVVTEVDINTVSGVSSYYGTRTNLIMLGIGILALLLPFPIYRQFRIFQSTWRSFGMQHNFGVELLAIILVILSIVIGLGLLGYCRRQVFHLQIFSSQATGAPITIGEGYGNLGGAKVMCALIGRPTKDTDLMMTELGAMISDIKEMGDHAIELWEHKKPFNKIFNKNVTTTD